MTMSRTNWIRIILLAILVLIVLFAIRLHDATGHVPTQDLSGDASSGYRLAEAWCAECRSAELVVSVTGAGTGN